MFRQSSDIRDALDAALLEDSNHQPFIVHARPRRLNQRMLVQQGVMLCKAGHSESFASALTNMLLRVAPKVPCFLYPAIRRIVIDVRRRPLLIEELRRMNATAASLFPGIDGFARSLRFDLEGLRHEGMTDDLFAD